MAPVQDVDARPRRKRISKTLQTDMGPSTCSAFKLPPCRRCRVKKVACVYKEFGPDAKCRRCNEKELPCPRPVATEGGVGTGDGTDPASSFKKARFACIACKTRKRACGIGLSTAVVAETDEARPAAITPDGSVVPACDFCVRHNLRCEYSEVAAPGPERTYSGSSMEGRSPSSGGSESDSSKRNSPYKRAATSRKKSTSPDFTEERRHAASTKPEIMPGQQPPSDIPSLTTDNFASPNDAFLHQPFETSRAGTSRQPEYAVVLPFDSASAVPINNFVVAAVPAGPIPPNFYPYYAHQTSFPGNTTGFIDSVYGVAPFNPHVVARDALLVSPDISFASGTSPDFSPGATLTELTHNDEGNEASGDTYPDLYQETTNHVDRMTMTLHPRSAMNVSEFPASDLDPLPDPSIMNYYIQRAFKSFFPYIQIFSPAALNDLRKRSPLTLWAISLSGAIMEGDVVCTRPFMQRLSRVWNIAKKSDGNLWDLTVNHPYGQPCLDSVQTLFLMLNTLSTTWAEKNIVDREKTCVAFYRKMMETFHRMQLASQAHDNGTRIEVEERRRTAIVSFNVEQWASLFILKKPTSLKTDLLPALKPTSKFAPAPQIPGGIDSSSPPILNYLCTLLQFDKDTMFALLGEVADFQALECCTTAACDACKTKQLAILAKYDTWFKHLPTWIQDFDATGNAPDQFDVRATDPSDYVRNVSWVSTMLELYHAGVLNLLRPRTGPYTFEWCGTDGFVTSTEHAIRASSVMKTMLHLCPTYEYSAPFTAYSLLQPALVHRCYIDYMKSTLGQVEGNGPIVQLLVDQAQAQLAVLLKALKVLAPRWISGQHALIRFSQNLPFCKGDDSPIATIFRSV